MKENETSSIQPQIMMMAVVQAQDAELAKEALGKIGVTI